MSLSGAFFDIAIFIIALSVAYIVGSYVNATYAGWGYVVGIIVGLLELSIISKIRDW